jgi:hypothetical protein
MSLEHEHQAGVSCRNSFLGVKVEYIAQSVASKYAVDSPE